MAIGAAPATAQQTPQTYCGTLPATSCEILNVEVGALPGGTGYGVAGVVKYCRNQQLTVVLLSGIGGNNCFMGAGIAFYKSSGTSLALEANPSSSCPGQGTVPNQWTNVSLCAALP